MGKIFLKNNWAEPFIYGDESPGTFVGRKDELESLEFALLNNDSGAILISAVRGVGKTSFVHKALSDTKGKVYPIFVNSGDVVSSLEDKAAAKKGLLTSLIRAAYFAFKKDDEIEELYYKAIGEFKEYKTSTESDEKNSEKEVNLAKEYNLKNLLVIGGTILATLGITMEEQWVKILGYIGLMGIPITFTWKKTWIKTIKKTLGKETIVENSIDYIELLFENWLKKQKGKNLVFVIDELDKVEEEKNAFKLIKEYKNLFSRSFAHFIFIAGPEAHQLTKENRESNAKDGGIFPTLFTHSYYLPLPTTKELQEYLSEITNSETHKEEGTILKNYLLFNSKNDFFILKNVINDLLLFEDGKGYLDTEHIKNVDLYFDRASKIYNYTSLFCEKKFKRGKKFWEENSRLQKDIFEFLNNHIKSNFEVDIKKHPSYITDLLQYLQRLGTISEITNEDEEERTLTKFRWTGNYKDIEEADQLFEEETTFLNKFSELTTLANDLNYIVNSKRYTKVYKGHDGEQITGVSLHSTYAAYEDLKKKIEDSQKRMSVLIEDVKSATEDLDTQIGEIYQDILEITAKGITNSLKGKNNFYLNQTFDQRPSAFKSCNNFNTAFSKFEHKLFGRNDGRREVLIVENFNELDNIEHGLSMLNGNRDLLVINIVTDEKINLPEHPTIYVTKNGRKWKKGMVVKNFYNYQFQKISNIKSYIHRINQYFQYY